MPDVRFFDTAPAISFDAALALAGATLLHAAGAPIARVAATDEHDLTGAVVFVDDKALAAGFKAHAGLVLTRESLASLIAGESPVATLAAPRIGFARLAAALHRERTFVDDAGGPTDIDRSAKVHPTAVIARGAKIGADVEIGPYTVIGPGVVIGARTRVGSGVTIMCALLGADILVKSGARIGEAGFGFVPGPEGLVKMPQLGRAVIGDGAEIGANACVDRGALGDTVIEANAKIDNLVQIAHNVRVGASSVIAAQAGVSGSTKIGRGAMLGGKAGLADHLTVGDGAQVAAAAGVMHDIPAGERWGGSPARPMRQWFRETATLAKLAMRGKSKDAD